MQIVIKISDDTYKYWKETKPTTSNIYVIDAIEGIKNGTPLPEHHGRLIDADLIQFENAEFDTYGDYCIAFDAIDQADTIIEGSDSE